MTGMPKFVIAFKYSLFKSFSTEVGQIIIPLILCSFNVLIAFISLSILSLESQRIKLRLCTSATSLIPFIIDPKNGFVISGTITPIVLVILFERLLAIALGV